VTTGSNPEHAGSACPLDAVRRAAAEGGVGLQRDLADRALAQLDRAEEHRRRARLSSHYTAVRAVDQLEEIHPDEEASLDPLYDGVGRTFDALATVDDGAVTAAADGIEVVADVADEAGERYLDVSETTCEPLLERLGETEPTYGEYGPGADD
jgi:hypothetical protein